MCEEGADDWEATAILLAVIYLFDFMERKTGNLDFCASPKYYETCADEIREKTGLELKGRDINTQEKRDRVLAAIIDAGGAVGDGKIKGGNSPLSEGACSGNCQHRKILGPLPAEGRCAFPVPGGVATTAPNEVC